MRIAIIALTILPLSATDSSAANLFDILFGRRPAVAQGYNHDAAAARAGLDAARRSRANAASPASGAHLQQPRKLIELAKPGPYTPPPVEPGYLGQFLRDSSLRPGDVVATTEGLMIYRGRGGARHSEKDFRPVSAERNQGGERARTLAAIDKDIRTRQYTSVSSQLSQPTAQTRLSRRTMAQRVE